jgi:hypothetical protein
MDITGITRITKVRPSFSTFSPALKRGQWAITILIGERLSFVDSDEYDAQD